mgnify:CR=1 FL=1
MSYKVEKLSKNFHERGDFDCGSEEQNKFIKNHAWENYQRGFSVPYVAVEESSPKIVCGFYSLAMGRVKREDTPEDWKDDRTPNYPVPTVLIGQLGVDIEHQGNGLGRFLLLNAVARGAVTATEDVAAAAIEVDARNEKARGFFQKHEFVPMQDDENHLFLGMSVAKSVAERVKSTTLSGRLARS